MTRDLRTFLESVDKVEVRREVDPKWELSAVQQRLEADGERPVLVFDNVSGHSMPVVTNLFASKERLAHAIDSSPERVIERFAEAQANRVPPKEVSSVR